ncbi:type IV pilus biogenesis protein PilM [Ornithinibacillus salinisoli]|uniref:Type IV pilus biogenesis protein PilM n=1 Tax=Ornithinibacillus salinisoli TaxID=1848459 RepID=A0ABW4W3H7_9BACI
MFGKPAKVINLVIEDYVIRMVEINGSNISSIKIKEKAIPFGLIENGKILDEIGFFEFMKKFVKEFGVKNRHVRFYVPNSLVIMRQVKFPMNLRDKEIDEYFREEIGKSLHLPFKDPVFDVHYLPLNGEGIESEDELLPATLFAAPKEEMMKYTEIFDDVSLKPVAADVEALGVYRYFYHMNNVHRNHVYIIIELDVTSFNISIFKRHQLEFLRYQTLDLHLVDSSSKYENLGKIKWKYEEDEKDVRGVVEDQIVELERIMNFYRFSMKKGEEMVNELIILGDHPFIDEFYQSAENHFDIPTRLLGSVISSVEDKEIGPQFIPALGLALKGGNTNAS